MDMFFFLSMHIYMYAHIHALIHSYARTHTCTHIHVHMYTHMHTYIHTHVCTQTNFFYMCVYVVYYAKIKRSNLNLCQGALYLPTVARYMPVHGFTG